VLAERGWRVGVLDRDPPPMGFEHLKADLTDARGTEAEIAGWLDGRPLDALVCAAGIDACGRLTEVSAEDWERVVQVNLVGLVACVRAALPSLRQAGGRVLTVASTLALRPLSDATAYCASKAGVLAFSRSLAAEEAGSVGVTTLIPGGMRTAFFDGRTEQYRPGPDARLNDPALVAEAVCFALEQPKGCEVRELVICPDTEPSWP
jgi:NAD(P)-dependent dehydrogenase (short-subunit alcohol dehydrogenase family)